MLGSYSPALSPPCDRFNLVYLCMIMAGAGFLFPWSSYITAVDYFFFLYWSDFHQVSVAIPMAYLVSTSLFTVVTVTIANHTSCHSRIGFGYVIFFFALLAVPLIDVAVHSCALPVKAAFYLTILTVLAVGVGSGGMQDPSHRSPASFSPLLYTSMTQLFLVFTLILPFLFLYSSSSPLSSAVQLLRCSGDAPSSLCSSSHGRGECGGCGSHHQ